jgi:hypothetical protein
VLFDVKFAFPLVAFPLVAAPLVAPWPTAFPLVAAPLVAPWPTAFPLVAAPLVAPCPIAFPLVAPPLCCAYTSRIDDVLNRNITIQIIIDDVLIVVLISKLFVTGRLRLDVITLGKILCMSYSLTCI